MNRFVLGTIVGSASLGVLSNLIGSANSDIAIKVADQSDNYTQQVFDLFVKILNPPSVAYDQIMMNIKNSYYPYREGSMNYRVVVAVNSDNIVVGAALIRFKTHVPWRTVELKSFKTDNPHASENAVEIEAVAIDLDYQGMGVGSKLFDKCVEIGRKHNLESIWLGSEARYNKREYWSKKMQELVVHDTKLKGKVYFFAKQI